MNIYQFMSDSPIVTVFLGYLLAELLLKVISRSIRGIVVSIRGWPPAHLDADGDWKKDDEK